MKRIITELKDGKIIPVCELNELDIKAIAVALYHQWHRTVDDDGKAATCSQEMADTTYRMLEMFENFDKQNAIEKVNLEEGLEEMDR